MQWLKKVVSKLPEHIQNELKQVHCRLQLRRGTFVPDEPEYELLPSIISTGDWAIDVGANVGHYTKRFSELVGATGRVIAFEPVPDTFKILTSNMRLVPIANVTLINAAASNSTGLAGISIPLLDTGLRNYYEAHLNGTSESIYQVLTISIDSLNIRNKVSLVKIDAEGHDYYVLKGMKNILHRDKPTLIIEHGSAEVKEYLEKIGYVQKKLVNSPNIIFRYQM